MHLLLMIILLHLSFESLNVLFELQRRSTRKQHRHRRRQRRWRQRRQRRRRRWRRPTRCSVERRESFQDEKCRFRRFRSTRRNSNNRFVMSGRKPRMKNPIAGRRVYTGLYGGEGAQGTEGAVARGRRAGGPRDQGGPGKRVQSLCCLSKNEGRIVGSPPYINCQAFLLSPFLVSLAPKLHNLAYFYGKPPQRTFFGP